MYPFASLPENLAAFCDTLRRAHGFQIGPAELRDAARALEVVRLDDERAVRHALRPILSGSEAQALVFDRAFRDFFLPEGAGVQQGRLPPRGAPGSAPAEQAMSRRTSLHDSAGEADAVGVDDEHGRSKAAIDASDSEAAPRVEMLRASYSPLHGSSEAPTLTRAGEAWRAAAGRLVRRVRAGRSRRWRPAVRGRRFDLRRTLRSSLQTGGEVGRPRWLARPRRNPRFVVLIDGSRSMSPYTDAALRMSVAIASVTTRVEVFTFSTTLRCVTRDVRRAAAGESRRLPALHRAWGGGTSIGRCLHEFIRADGGRLLGNDTLVIIVSDGLDLGPPEILRDAMRELYRRSAAIVWLNPLLDTAGYEPTAGGMRAAMPFVTTFASVRDAGSFDRLSKVIRERA
jgi:uncharacterized protein with von Willebrand factor type A (vWA) domain